MSDFMITIGICKTMLSTLLFVTALLLALNRTSVQDYFQKNITKKRPDDWQEAVITGWFVSILPDYPSH